MTNCSLFLSHIKDNEVMFIIKLISIVFFIMGISLLISSCAVKRYTVNFINPACITPYQNYDYYTCESLFVRIEDRMIIIPKGFKTNLSSIPRLLWSIYAPQYTEFVAPAILHDYMYSTLGFKDRRYADDMFYSALRENGVSWFTSTAFWLAVRLFGKPHYLRMNHG